jgi:hypothetical protein
MLSFEQLFAHGTGLTGIEQICAREVILPSALFSTSIPVKLALSEGYCDHIEVIHAL